MTTFNSLTLILCLQTLLFIISIPSSHPKTFHPNDETLIYYTCSKTPYYDLCVLSLILSPGSDRADIWDLAGIMLNHVMKVKANKALDKIHELQSAGTGPKQGLDSCASKYSTILVADIPKANEAWQKENTKVAEDEANDAANEAINCQTDFPGPLTSENKVMHDVAANAAAIFKLLHSHQ